MKVSILMPVADQNPDWLKTALNSVVGQNGATLGKDYEIIVVDDCCHIETGQILQDYADRHKITLACHAYQKGPAEALNLALSLAKGKYVARQDSDDIWDSWKLYIQLKYMEGRPDLDMTYTDAMVLRKDGKMKPAPTPDYVYGMFLVKNQIKHGTIMIKTKVLRNLGGYYEVQELSIDYDLWLRFEDAGYRMGRINIPLFALRVHDGTLSNTKKELQEKRHNEALERSLIRRGIH